MVILYTECFHSLRCRTMSHSPLWLAMDSYVEKSERVLIHAALYSSRFVLYQQGRRNRRRGATGLFSVQPVALENRNQKRRGACAEQTQPDVSAQSWWQRMKIPHGVTASRNVSGDPTFGTWVTCSDGPDQSTVLTAQSTFTEFVYHAL